MYTKALELLKEYESKSWDTRKVGCFATDGVNIIGGFNQPPLPFMKYRDLDNNTLDYVIHAEQDVLIKLPEGTYDLYVSYAPCKLCASLIIKSNKIRKVYYRDVLSNHTEGLSLLQLAKIPFECIKKETNEHDRRI